jgi:N-acetylglucosaminyl-diphospho-decaprenol L-rhamnosyltransferase
MKGAPATVRPAGEDSVEALAPDLTISIISADNLELLLPCLRSVFASAHCTTLQVFVVDNASSDETAAVVQGQFPKVEIIRNSERLGFSTNNNLVLGQGVGRYLMLLNDDTVVLNGALDRMVEFMDQHVEAGAVGGCVLNPDGSFQPSFARFPHPLLEGLWPATNWAHRSMRKAKQPFRVDSVCGAAMLVRRSVFDRVGGLDPDFDPIYSEEVDWCYRIAQAGWQVYALPQARIIHYGSQTMNRVVPRKYELLLSHKALFFRKHGTTGAATVFRLSLALSTLTKLLWWTTLGWALGRETSRQKREVHWHVLRRISSF